MSDYGIKYIEHNVQYINILCYSLRKTRLSLPGHSNTIFTPKDILHRFVHATYNVDNIFISHDLVDGLITENNAELRLLA